MIWLLLWVLLTGWEDDEQVRVQMSWMQRGERTLLAGEELVLEGRPLTELPSEVTTPPEGGQLAFEGHPRIELPSEAMTPPGGGQLALEGRPWTELQSGVKTLLAGGQFEFENHQTYELLWEEKILKEKEQLEIMWCQKDELEGRLGLQEVSGMSYLRTKPQIPPLSSWGVIKVCPYCRAGLLQQGESSFCCREGRITVEPLPPLPSSWTEMFMDPVFRRTAGSTCTTTCSASVPSG